MNKLELIKNINLTLDTIAIINSFVNDGKTYYISLLNKIDEDIEKTLRNHFNVKNWTFDLNSDDQNWKEIFNKELLFYFGQYILQAKSPYLSKEYEGLRNEQFEGKNREIILRSETNVEILLSLFISRIEMLVGSKYEFFKLKVNWDSSSGYEYFYECYENDYLFDLGSEVLFLHFGASD